MNLLKRRSVVQSCTLVEFPTFMAARERISSSLQISRILYVILYYVSPSLCSGCFSTSVSVETETLQAHEVLHQNPININKYQIPSESQFRSVKVNEASCV